VVDGIDGIAEIVDGMVGGATAVMVDGMLDGILTDGATRTTPLFGGKTTFSLIAIAFPTVLCRGDTTRPPRSITLTSGSKDMGVIMLMGAMGSVMGLTVKASGRDT
jgi:hypothetical protein